MSFIRPQARAALWRWREVLSGLGLAILGLWWGIGSYGLLQWLGYLLLILAGAVLLMGLQRARFRAGAGGPGVVQVDEGQVAYFGPLTGGVVAIRDLDALTLDPTGKPPHWVLSTQGAPALHIPLNAEGAEALFDAFAALPGLRTEHMLTQMRRLPDHPTVIWQKSQSMASHLRLH
ncbi:MAG: hypothetical protein KBT70_06165 [Roseovarius sp.]|uniref:hypothetical protein n=1 Tax=Roseovarius sp. TaxID=1486281 RepID=UPI001B559E60|nr:hypothetical protein [Roseovarius sp.]MBQ0749769.1 hypothetical protein [Roseovarius sp.]MBQ0809759.1 hypothetical protein [Roseovarius sp.]